jgi:hypothetical protein
LPRQLQAFVSWCESTDENEIKCGNCSSCKRMIDVGIMQNRKYEKLSVEDDILKKKLHYDNHTEEKKEEFKYFYDPENAQLNFEF